jgi:catecholate siderophore receptor
VFALESVEVSKGADSAFGGRGSGGGSINLITKQAKAENFGAGSVTVGTSDTVRGTIDENYQINNTTAARINVLGTRGNVPGRDDAVDYDKWGVAGSLAFGLGTPTRITADYYHLTDNGMPDYSIPYDLADGRPVTETKGTDSKNFYGLIDRDFRKSSTDLGTISIARDLDGGMLLRNVTRYGNSINSYVVSNPDDSSGNVANGYVYRSSKTRWSSTDTIANVTDLTGKFKTGYFEHSFNTGLEVDHEKRTQDSWLVTRVPAGTALCLHA